MDKLMNDKNKLGNRPTIGLISLGCPKALVDSEKILTTLKKNGYDISLDYEDANVAIVNTCGFLDSAKAESLRTIGEAIQKNGKVIVTGCLGANESTVREAHPSVLSITGPDQAQRVLKAVQSVVKSPKSSISELIPNPGIKLTPRHYSYIKISEGCNHHCKFCIIPEMRGKLTSRSISSIMKEAENLVLSGSKELLIVSQDTSAYGIDLPKDVLQEQHTNIYQLASTLGELGVWIRLHYVYPYPSVKKLIPLMAEKKILPYLDIPFQHSHPETLKRMARPAKNIKILKDLEYWRSICPDLNIRSTFIVGYPGETESEFNHLLDWLDEAQLDRVGCFKYENVEGARANSLPNHIPELIKENRWHQFMEKAQEISKNKLFNKVGSNQEVLVDSVDNKGAICRTMADAPEIDGNLFIDDNFENLHPGDLITVKVEESNEYDLWGTFLK